MRLICFISIMLMFICRGGNAQILISYDGFNDRVTYELSDTFELYTTDELSSAIMTANVVETYGRPVRINLKLITNRKPVAPYGYLSIGNYEYFYSGEIVKDQDGKYVLDLNASAESIIQLIDSNNPIIKVSEVIYLFPDEVKDQLKRLLVKAQLFPEG